MYISVRNKQRLIIMKMCYTRECMLSNTFSYLCNSDIKQIARDNQCDQENWT